MMYQKQNKRRKRSKKFFKALHIIVITLKYAFKILKELKAIIDLSTFSPFFISSFA